MSASVDGPPGAGPASPPGFSPATYRANLYVHHPDGRVEWYALLPASFVGGRTLVLGRDADAAIPIDDEAVSGRHAGISARGEALWLTDLSSTNGTLLDDRPVAPGRPVRLEHGAVVTIGNADVRFLYSHRQSPLRLALVFTGGPHAGSRRTTAGASTTLGERDCEITLTGPGVAPHHLRVDAYAGGRLYAVPLAPAVRTRLHGAEVAGVSALADDAELEIGPHRFRVRVIDGPGAPAGGPERAPPRVDAAMHEARLAGRDPRAFDNRTIMDLSPLGAMVAKVLAGEVPPPPSAVRPPARRRTRPGVHADDEDGPPTLMLRRPTGPSKPVRPRPPRWTRWAAAGLVLVAALAVAGQIPVPQVVQREARITTAEPVEVRAPVRARLVRAVAGEGERVRAGAALARLADAAIEAELDRLSTRIGAMEGYAGGGRVGPRAIAVAEAAVEAARGVLDAALDAGAPDYDAVLVARARLAEHHGRLEALRERRRDRRAGPADAAAELGRLIERREDLERRLRIDLDAPVTGRITAAPREAPGAEVDAGRPLYRLVPLDPLVLRLDGLSPAEVEVIEGAGRQAVITLDGQPAAVVLAPDPAGGYRARLDDPMGRLPIEVAVPLRVEGRPLTAMRWLVRALGGP